ncbi:hypothetical protein QYE76_065419 [Lolium multiflorum]|uniref:Uncharacterized protein n=1 Tax=Lolium multiflorum TaxID=4521 RepID=A0AAD8WB13_LOLMU|nr:hypothetical protein QYE76_065419 [Lolium multiflorum]
MEKDGTGQMLRGDQPRGPAGVAPMEMFFSASAPWSKASRRGEARLARLESTDHTVSDRRTALYNRLVAGYHKAKIERAEMARELEAAKAAKVVTAKAQETHGELERLRRLESNHVTELKAARETGRKEVEDLSRRLKDVEEQSRALRDEVTSKSQELTDTAKR